MLFWLMVASAGAAETTVLAQTTAPLEVGVRARTEGPGRMQLSAGLGYLPNGYIDLFNGVATELGAYDQTTADLIGFAIQRSALASLDVGWRPAASLGLRCGLGYSLAALGGDGTGAELLATAAGVGLPESAGARRGALAVDLSATVHFLRPEVGWTLPVGARSVLEAGVGGAFTVASHARVTPLRGGSSGPLGAFVSETEDWLETTLNRWVHTPAVSLGIGVKLGALRGGREDEAAAASVGGPKR